MGKAVGCFLGLVTFSLFAEGIGIFLFALTIMFFVGSAVGENETLLVIYIVGAMAASYLLPIALSIYAKKVVWLIIVPAITSLLFAIPSSFIFNAGCTVGSQKAVWAMRADPAVWIAETLMATESDNLPSDCVRLRQQG